MTDTQVTPVPADRLPTAAGCVSAVVAAVLLLGGIIVLVWGTITLHTEPASPERMVRHWSCWSITSALFMIPGAIALAIMLMNRTPRRRRVMLACLSLATAASFVAAGFGKAHYDAVQNAARPNEIAVTDGNLRLNVSGFLACVAGMGMILSFSRHPPATQCSNDAVPPLPP